MVDGTNSSALRVERAACEIKAAQNYRRQTTRRLPAKGVLLARRSEFGRQIAVDLEPDTDFDKRWRGPGHALSSSCDHVERNVGCSAIDKLRQNALITFTIIDDG